MNDFQTYLADHPNSDLLRNKEIKKIVEDIKSSRSSTICFRHKQYVCTLGQFQLSTNEAWSYEFNGKGLMKQN